MPEPPRSERKMQNRVIALFTDTARPDCLGEWNQRPNNRCNDAKLLRTNLTRREKPRALKQAMMQELQSPEGQDCCKITAELN